MDSDYNEVMQYSGGIRVFCSIMIFCIILLYLLNIYFCAGDSQYLYWMLFLGTMVLFGVLLPLVHVLLWKITIYKDKFTYRNFLGIVKTCSFSEIDKVVYGKLFKFRGLSPSTSIYKNGRRILVISSKQGYAKDFYSLCAIKGLNREIKSS